MGTILSSNKDYNRILAKQPRKSIGLTKLVASNNPQQYPLVETLSIPVPVRNQIPVSSNEPSPSELNPTSTQHNSTPITDNQSQQKQPSMHRSTSFSQQPNFPIHNQTMNNDALVVSRSVMNLNNHRRSNHRHFSSFRPNHSVIERNGKQFVTELQERMERRYVEVFDETLGRMRLFEVTDYIPSKTVRAIRPNSQFQSQNGIARNSLPPNLSLNHRAPIPSMSNNRTQPPPPSNLVDFKGLNNRETIAQEFDLYHSGATLPFNNNNPNNPSRPPLTTQQSNDSNYSRSQPKAYNTSTRASQEVPNQYTSGSYHSQTQPYRSQPQQNRSQTQPYRAQSRTGSDYSVTTSKLSSKSEDTNSEGVDRTARSSARSVDNNRNNSDVTYGTIGGRDSPVELDPFKKTVSTGEPYYRKRPGINNYSEPIMNNRNLQNSTGSDYSPIRAPHNQSNQNQYSHRKDSNAYDG